MKRCQSIYCVQNATGVQPLMMQRTLLLKRSVEGNGIWNVLMDMSPHSDGILATRVHTSHNDVAR